MVQWIAVIAVLAIAAAYIVYRIFSRPTPKSDCDNSAADCSNCPVKQHCTKTR